MRSVFAIKVRSGMFTRAEGMFLMRQFQGDIASNGFGISVVLDLDFDTAGSLMERYAFDLRLGTLDALQLAVAVRLRRQAKLDYFVASDKALCEVATHEGFAVINPEQA